MRRETEDIKKSNETSKDEKYKSGMKIYWIELISD